METRFIQFLVAVILCIGVTQSAKGPRADIFNIQDIGQFRDIAKSPNGVVGNALPLNSRFKWKSRDAYGNYQIPYVIAGPFNRDEYQMIINAMVRIQANTCIRFIRRTKERDFINIESVDGEGCFAYVGNHGGRSSMNLESSSKASCMFHDIVIHELLHSVGLWHEHMRHDRDNYIKVHYENINRAMSPQFIKIPQSQGETYGTKYDYSSVMHYDKSAFAKKKGLLTMETLDKNAQGLIGKAKDASYSDYKKVCAMYGCKSCYGSPIRTEAKESEKKSKETE
uniref:Metalloendopeptidase n=1 Tax=Panagrolaimus davidi TaxID=227884 RepID=A0A914Q8U9_9BILA